MSDEEFDLFANGLSILLRWVSEANHAKINGLKVVRASPNEEEPRTYQEEKPGA